MEAKTCHGPGRLTAAINIYRANLGLILPKDRPKVDCAGDGGLG